MHYQLQFKDLDYTFCLAIVLLNLDLTELEISRLDCRGRMDTVTNRRDLDLDI